MCITMGSFTLLLMQVATMSYKSSLSNLACLWCMALCCVLAAGKSNFTKEKNGKHLPALQIFTGKYEVSHN